MTGTPQAPTSHSESALAKNNSRPTGKHVHHGRTPAAWAGVGIAMVAFVVGGLGMVLGPNWTMFWIGVALLVVSLIVTKILQLTGHGAD